MVPDDLQRLSPGHYASKTGRGRVIRMAQDATRWQAVKPTGDRSPVVSSLSAAYDWLIADLQQEAS
jgi:hypothetical protein